MISGHGNIETAVEAVKKGAYDYISKPPDLNRPADHDPQCDGWRTAWLQKPKCWKRKYQRYRKWSVTSAPIIKIKDTIDKVAATDARILITGENGVGKGTGGSVDTWKSNRASGPLVEVNCAAIPTELIESELFGHEKGSFTSAIKQRIGKFEQANGGTLVPGWNRWYESWMHRPKCFVHCRKER